MSKLGMAGAAMGVGGTGAAGIYGAHKLGAFGGEGDASSTGSRLTVNKGMGTKSAEWRGTLLYFHCW